MQVGQVERSCRSSGRTAGTRLFRCRTQSDWSISPITGQLIVSAISFPRTAYSTGW